MSKSSVHKGGYGRLEAGRGIGLRFPRFIRDRDDKKPENATSSEQITDMFNSQADVDTIGRDADDNGDGDEDELI